MDTFSDADCTVLRGCRRSYANDREGYRDKNVESRMSDGTTRLTAR